MGIAAALVACGGDDPTTPPADNPLLAEATIGAAGGSLVSSDGILTLEFRPSTFDIPTYVSIETLVGKDPGYRIDAQDPSPAVGVLASWDLGALAKPEDDRYRHRFTWLQATSAEPVPQPAAQRLRLDGERDRIELSGELSHLQVTLGRTEEDLVLGMGPVPPVGLAGTRLLVEVEIEQSAASTVGAQVGFTDRRGELPQPQPLELTSIVEQPLASIERGVAFSYREPVAAYRWENVPSGRFWAELDLAGLEVDGLALEGAWSFELYLPVRGSEVVPEGDVFPARTGFPTDLIVPLLPWGPFTDSPVVGVVGSDGVPFLDATTGILVNGDLIGLESLLGGIALSNINEVAARQVGARSQSVGVRVQSPDDGPAFPSFLLEALFLYGSGGAGLSTWAWGMGEFTPPIPIEEGAEVVDATAYGGHPTWGGLCYAMPSLNEVGFVEPNLAGDRFERSELRIDVSGFPNAPGPVISAYRREFGGEVLVLCDGAPGALFLWDPADSNAVEIGPVGDDPANLRGMGTVAVVSNFGSGTITTISWPLGGMPTIRASLPANGGPRGMDLRPNGNEYELLGVGFDTDRLYSYLLSSTGTMLSIADEALPVGCWGPSTAVFVPGDVELVAGFSSDTLARFGPPQTTRR
jgi:hypothetical protein